MGELLATSEEVKQEMELPHQSLSTEWIERFGVVYSNKPVIPSRRGTARNFSNFTLEVQLRKSTEKEKNQKPGGKL
jgi:hypothetical protein